MRLFIFFSALTATALARPGGYSELHGEPEVHHAHAQLYHGPPAPLGHDGRVVDTPEVAHAKAAHFHAYSDELSKLGPIHPEPEPSQYEPAYQHQPQQQQQHEQVVYLQQQHHQPQLHQQQQHQQQLEPVAAHHALPAVQYQHPEPDHNHVYHGPPAPLAHDGRVVDTAEVAHAKAAHFNAYAEELSKLGPISHHAPAYRHGPSAPAHQQDLGYSPY